MSLDRALQQLSRLVEEEVSPRAAIIDRERRFSVENFRSFGQQGLLGLMVPEEFGGLGGNLTALVEACETVAKGCASTAMCFLMHHCGTAVIAAKATREQGERFLRPIARGEKIATLAFSERGTGAHFYQPEMQARFRDGQVWLSGKKSFVTNGDQADYLLLITNATVPEKGSDIFLLASDQPGVSFEGEWDGLGMAGNNSIALNLDNVRLSWDALLGEEGDGAAVIFQVVAPHFLLGISAVNLGTADAAFQTALSHATARKYTSGTSLAEIPAIQSHLAEMQQKVELLRSLLYRAAAKADQGDEQAVLLAMQSKIAASETAVQVTDQAMQVCGGQGYSRRLPLERYLRDARASAVMAPTTDVLKGWIGKSLAGLPLF